MSDHPWTLAPYLRVNDANAAIAWYVRALGAIEKERHEMPDGKIGHAELDVHGNLLCLADASGPGHASDRDNLPIILYAVVPDVDAVFHRAIETGAVGERPLADQPLRLSERRLHRPLRSRLVRVDADRRSGQSSLRPVRLPRTLGFRPRLTRPVRSRPARARRAGPGSRISDA